MTKRYLLTAGPRYYPSSGDGNWIKTFETEEEAELTGAKLLKDDAKSHYYDWYEVIDLFEWMEQE